MKSFYKNSDDNWIVNGEIQNRMGDWKLGYHTDNTYAKVTNDGAIVINNPITEIEKDDSGNKYDSYNEFNSAVSDFFVKASGGSGEASWGGVSGNIEDQEDLTNALDSKVDKVAGKQLSDENYTLDEKNKLDNLSTVATTGSYDDLVDKPTIVDQVNSDWNASSGVEQILNKPAWIGSTKPTYTKSEVGLGNVDNTSDLNKPISTATQNALNNYVSLTGAETVQGVKTFGSIPVLPATNPTTANQAVRKQYVDDQLATKLNVNQIQVVSVLPGSPDPNTLYLITE